MKRVGKTKRCALRAIAASTLLLLGNAPSLRAITIVISNPYTIGAIDQSGLNPAATAGAPIRDPWPASPDNNASGVLISVGDAAGAWRIDVQQINVAWDPDVQIQVQRRTSGTGPGTAPSGGTTYITLDGSVQSFFTGTLNRSNIRIRFRLQMNPPATRLLPFDTGSYSADIVFTVTDT